MTSVANVLETFSFWKPFKYNIVLSLKIGNYKYWTYWVYTLEVRPNALACEQVNQWFKMQVVLMSVSQYTNYFLLTLLLLQKYCCKKYIIPMFS